MSLGEYCRMTMRMKSSNAAFRHMDNQGQVSADRHNSLHVVFSSPLNKSIGPSWYLHKSDDGNDSMTGAVIVLKAAASVTQTHQLLEQLTQQFSLLPIVILVDGNRPDLADILTLPARDFLDANSSTLLLEKKLRGLALQKKPDPELATPQALELMEAEVWSSIFNHAGAGMLTGKYSPFKQAKDQLLSQLKSNDEVDWLAFIQSSLAAIPWELNNDRAAELLELDTPVSLSRAFVNRLRPLNKTAFGEGLMKLSNACPTVRGDFDLTLHNGGKRQLSLEVNIAPEAHNLVLVTLLDITERTGLERALRRNVQELESRVEERTLAVTRTHRNLERESIQRKRLSNTVRESLAHITQGIISAKRILEVALPGTEDLRRQFPGAILISKPRDILGGDFLFTGIKGNRRTLALIDSTGHGIPGAMVSLMGSTLINKSYVTLGNPDPSSILKHFHQEFDVLMKVNQGTPQMYGFDAGILTVDDTTQTIEFAGARGDLYLVRDGQTHTIRGTRSSIEFDAITRGQNVQKEYQLHKVSYRSGDQFYMITDGVRDQFGGEKNRKLGRKRLCDILAKHAALGSKEREKAIQKDLLIWKGANAKVDDATLVGISF